MTVTMRTLLGLRRPARLAAIGSPRACTLTLGSQRDGGAERRSSGGRGTSMVEQAGAVVQRLRIARREIAWPRASARRLGAGGGGDAGATVAGGPGGRGVWITRPPG